MSQKDQKGSMITDTFTINLGHCVHTRLNVYMYLIYVMTGQNISNDGDKGVQICISPTFIEPSIYHGMHQCWMHVSDTHGRTDRRNTPVPLICLLTGVLDGRKTKLS